MSDYAFVHQGKAYTPNHTPVAADDAAAHNAEIERLELAAWHGQPDQMLAYFTLTDGHAEAPVTTWQSVKLGTIVEYHIYRHNFGGRFISLKVVGTNGARYHGRASCDWGQCVMLHKSKGKR